MDDNVKCCNCKFWYELKEFKDKEQVIKSACTFFPQTEEGYDAFAIITDAEDKCESFTEIGIKNE